MGRRSVDPYSPRLGPHAGQAAARLDVFQRARTTDGRPADRMCARGSEAAHRSTPWPMCAAIAAITIEKFAALADDPQPSSLVWIWLGRQDSNLGMAESKSAALPLGYAPTGGSLAAAARGP